VPLASTFMLSTKVGKEAYVESIIENGDYHFSVRLGKPKHAEAAQNGTRLARGANFRCAMSGTPVEASYIRTEARAGRMKTRLMAIVAEGEHGRLYLPPTSAHESLAKTASPSWKPDLKVPTPCHDVDRLPMYGMPTWGDAFTVRQLTALETYSGLVAEAVEKINCDFLDFRSEENRDSLRPPEFIPLSYAQAVATYLGLALSRWTDLFNSLVTWNVTNQNINHLFARQAIPMAWDFVESNPFGVGATFTSTIESFNRLFVSLPASPTGTAQQADAKIQNATCDKVVATDPPYYDNIGYANLSDFFYVWLRHSLQAIYPDLFATVAVPKADELVATPERHGTKEKAEVFFINGMTEATHRLADQVHPAFPITIFYAFKQSETKRSKGTASTGWETFLEAVIRSGLSVAGTWPVRTERTEGIKRSLNALASSIVLVCRPRSADAPSATRREFLASLKRELNQSLRNLQASNIAPVDLAQASIGPGMAIFTRYSKVLDVQGNPMVVREALALINQVLDEALAEQEGDFDADSRWALAWFEQHGFTQGEFGVAEILSKAKNTSVQGLAEAGILESKRGKVRLLTPHELPKDWDPATDDRLTNWESVHHLIRVLGSGGESAASELVSKLGSKSEPARELAYRLYALCERKKRAAEALAYNGLVQSWPELIRLAREGAKPQEPRAEEQELGV